MPLNDQDKQFIDGTVKGLLGQVQDNLAAEIRTVRDQVKALKAEVEALKSGTSGTLHVTGDLKVT